MEKPDLVAELRAPQPDECQACLSDGVKAVRCGRGDCAWTEDVRRRAADEIERLNATIQQINACKASNARPQ